MRLIHYLLAVGVLLVTSAAQAAGPPGPSCDALWKKMPPLKEISYDLTRSREIPDADTVAGFTVGLLRFADGRRFVPRNLRESDCYLDRVVSPPIRSALLEGAQEALLNHPGASAEDLLDAMYEASNQRLDSLFVGHGMGRGAGMPMLQSWIQYDYRIAGFKHERVSSLDKQAFSLGLYTELSIGNFVWLHYLEHLGVKQFKLEPFTQYLAGLDSQYAPPTTLTPPGCEQGIAYKWPTDSDPIDTFAKPDPDYAVHWGICKGTGALWVFKHGDGWRAVGPAEQAKFCESPTGSDRQFRGICVKK